MACLTPASSFSKKRSENEIQRSSPATMIDPTSAGASSSGAASYPTTSGTFDYPHDGFRHDVFINHRGEDTKKTFASYLYHRLLSLGFTAFLDQEELQEGLPFPSQIEDAIRTALVHVAIFSPKYAESRWCLEELHLMQESEVPIIPVFYHVDPSELRQVQNKTGLYGKALHNLRMKETKDPQSGMTVPRYDLLTIQKWMNALSSSADISGFDLDGKFKGDEGKMLEKLVQRIVEIISQRKRARFNQGKTRLYVAKYPTGLEDKIKDFEKVTRQQHRGKVQMVGIVGLGGVGKTTLALEFFNRKSSGYTNSHFLSDVRENAKSPSQLLHWQRELLKGLTKQHIDNIHQGKQMLKEILSDPCFQFLIVLDDVDNQEQVDSLLPDRDVYCSNTLILITSRDRDVLTKLGVEEISIYKLTGLHLRHSRQFFCSFAFSKPYPLRGFEDLVNEFVMACQGLPLSLKVFGAFLSGENDKSLWKNTLSRIHELPNDIHKKLKISYDALPEKEKQIFLDIACFFLGSKKDATVEIWDEPSCKGSSRFQNLESKCLVEVDSDNYIHMHDHLRDLGREIARDKLPLRLWHPTENIDTLLQSLRSIEVRAIKTFLHNDTNPDSYRNGYNVTLSWRERSEELLGNLLVNFSNKLHKTCYRFLGIGVEKLQLLDTEGHFLECILRRVHSPHLTWLSWHECPYYSLPSWIPMQNLRVLKVRGKLLKTLWQGRSQAPLHLRDLEIFGGLSNIPKSIGQLKHLERIFFCYGFFQKLPEEFCDMRILKILVLKECSRLKALPESFGNLWSLQHLELYQCSILEGLPESFSNLPNLQYLKLSYCRIWEELPVSFGNLHNLQHFELSSCGILELPKSFGNLHNLQHLELSCCEMLKRLPKSFGNLPNLQYLKLSYCRILEELPESFGHLHNLQHFELSSCRILELPKSFGNLHNLQHLELSCCEMLKRLPESFGNLPNLQYLKVSHCPILKGLPKSFGNLHNLQHFELSSCRILELPESFSNLHNLHYLKLSNCRILKGLPASFGNLSRLQSFQLYNCPIMKELPESFGNLPSLQDLVLSAIKFERLPESFGNLPSLQRMELSACLLLRTLPESLGNLPSLQNIKLSSCRGLRTLPESFGNLRSLRYMKLSSCSRLTRLPESFGNLRSLRHVKLLYCQNLGMLPESLGNLSNLQHLVVFGCRKLRRLPESFGNLRNLQEKCLCLSGPGLGVVERMPKPSCQIKWVT